MNSIPKEVLDAVGAIGAGVQQYVGEAEGKISALEQKLAEAQTREYNVPADEIGAAVESLVAAGVAEPMDKEAAASRIATEPVFLLTLVQKLAEELKSEKRRVGEDGRVVTYATGQKTASANVTVEDEYREDIARLRDRLG